MSLTARNVALLEFLVERLTTTLGDHAPPEAITKIIRDEAKRLLPRVEDRDIEDFLRDHLRKR
jgi:hypothetical protein